jgi:capsular polysaccharide biosynthesis protein
LVGERRGIARGTIERSFVKPKPDAGDWFETEESTRLGMIIEVQRIQRRLRARPWPVIVFAALFTAAVSYKLATLPQHVESEVVLALSEGAMARDTALPVDELRQYVQNVLLPDAKLAALIEKRNLFPSRRLQGMQFAVDSLRENYEIDIWKNQFASGEDEQERSARIGITYTDSDPDRAYGVARDLASVVIETAQDQRLQMTKLLAKNVADVRVGADERLAGLSRETTEKELALEDAIRDGRDERAQTLRLELAQIQAERNSANHTISEIANSRDALADRITEAGLDLTVSVVDEHRGQLAQNRMFFIVMMIFVIAIASFLGTALLFGAFDPRVHDSDDVKRLGLTVLGHLPGFPGDEVGSLRARGASRARVPSFMRWRSHR